MITMRVEGIDKVFASLDAVAERAREAVSSGIYDFVAGVGGEAVEEAPLGPTGNSRRSWFENDPELLQDTISVLSGFSIEYAIYVHENLEAHHNIGKAKFFEDPMNRIYPSSPTSSPAGSARHSKGSGAAHDRLHDE